MGADCQNKRGDGFTLIELSIVLVVIGLIVGGILVGQSLINAAGVRATITQIEKYNTAANTFREKYGFLPGDINASAAAQFGFAARGPSPGEGDGNGLLDGIGSAGFSQDGENLMFWVDLSTANLIDGGFTTATSTWVPSSPYPSGATLNSYLPPAKIGNGNYVYVLSGGWLENANTSNGLNYFGLSLVTNIGTAGCVPCLWSNPGLTVQQALSIDQKVDDGLPLTGRVLAAYISSNNWWWGSGNAAWQGAVNSAPPTSTPMVSSSTTCFDNGNNSSNTAKYSVEVSNGAGVNCGLVFQMQAGD